MKKLRFTLVFLLRGMAYFAALVLVVLLINNANVLYSRINNTKRFVVLKDYAGISISPYIDMSEEGLRKLDQSLLAFFEETNADNGLLFSIGNQMLLFDNDFMDEADLVITDYVVTVNTNYLHDYPIYDVDGNKVEISDDSEEDYLLIPEKFHEKEDEIAAYFIETNTFLKYYTDDVERLGVEKAHEQIHDENKLNIIYVKNNQDYVIYNSNIQGKLNGHINDPLIKVVTSNNVSAAQIPHYITSQDYLVNVKDGLDVLYDALESSGADEYVMSVNTKYKQSQQDIKINIWIVIIQMILVLFIQVIVWLAERKILNNVGILAFRLFLLSWIISITLFVFLYGSIGGKRLIGLVILMAIDIAVMWRIKRNSAQRE